MKKIDPEKLQEAIDYITAKAHEQTGSELMEEMNTTPEYNDLDNAYDCGEDDGEILLARTILSILS